MPASMSEEQFRAECEARHVLKLPSIHHRKDYLQKVEKKRGSEAARKLESDMLQQAKRGK